MDVLRVDFNEFQVLCGYPSVQILSEDISKDL